MLANASSVEKLPRRMNVCAGKVNECPKSCLAEKRSVACSQVPLHAIQTRPVRCITDAAIDAIEQADWKSGEGHRSASSRVGKGREQQYVELFVWQGILREIGHGGRKWRKGLT